MSCDVAPVPVVYQIPPPPSANAMYYRGRIKTPVYRAWQTEALWELKRQKAKPFGVPCKVSLSLPDNLRGDADNRLKCTLDTLVKAGVLKNDDKRYVRAVSATWVDKRHPCQVSLVAA